MTDPFNPTRPAGAYDDLLARVLPQAKAQRDWEPSDGPLPALFVSHGAPPTLDDPQWLDDLFVWAQTMPKPRAIVVVSAHWENAPLAISASDAGAPLYYDFGGFHPRYYTLQYRPPGRRHPRRNDATAPVHEPRARPRRVHPADGDVPGGRCAGGSVEHAEPRPGGPAEARHPAAFVA